MASMRKRGDSWQARVLRQGFPPETKTFPTKADADRWSRTVEAATDSRQFVSATQVVADFRDERLKECSAGTVIRDLAVLSCIFNHARRAWNVGVTNPVEMTRNPTAPPGRDRVLTLAEEGG